MICEYYNSLMDTCGFIIDGEIDTIMHKCEVALFNVIFWTFCTLILILCVSWWLIPLRFISNKLPTFKCRRRKR